MSKIFGIFLIVMLLGQSGCLFKSYVHDDNWVYFEDWDVNDDSKIDSTEFVNGYARDKFKDDQSAQAIFTACDDNEDGVVTGLEFYRWEANRGAPVKRDSAS